jgi:hypothetical protein
MITHTAHKQGRLKSQVNNNTKNLKYAYISLKGLSGGGPKRAIGSTGTQL